MKIAKIKAKNMFGLKEIELDGSSVELIGSNGVGKTSVIDAIRFALTNKSERDYIIKKGEEEGEIYIETDTGLSIDRKRRVNKADYKMIKEGAKEVASPESFLAKLFTELQINPVKFIMMSKKDQNKAILDLIEFEWDLNWIKEQFGEIPPDVDYSQNILQVLYDIQADSGYYFSERQLTNRSIKSITDQIEGYAEKLPANFRADYWESYDISDAYKRLADAERENNVIARAKIFRDSYDGKKRGIDADKEIAVTNAIKENDAEKNALERQIADLEKQIAVLKTNIDGLSTKLTDKMKVIDAEHDTRIAQLEKDIGTATEYMERTPIDTAPIKEEIETANKAKIQLADYKSMKLLQKKLAQLEGESEEFTRKIKKARELPGEILEACTLPIENLTVENGIPLINGMPVTNLSEGEKLNLCVDVTLAKTNGIQLILIDGVEKLSEENRKKLYQRCSERGVQIIATRTTDDDELLVVAL